MENKFIESDSYGRELLKELALQMGCTDIEETEGDYYPTDLYFKIKEKAVVSEIKVRDIKYENFDTHMMEVGKFNSLIKDKNDMHKDAAIYVCFFGDDICYWYKSSDIYKYAKRDRIPCNRTTAIYTGKKMKDVLLIPRDIGCKFIRENGEWIKSAS